MVWRMEPRWRGLFGLALVVAVMSVFPMAGMAQEASGSQVMQQFSGVEDRDQANEFSLKEKHQVMFLMGLALLVLLVVTVVLGIAMAIFGKQVFVAHMICAGLSVTLALAHSVVAVVWFFPF